MTQPPSTIPDAGAVDPAPPEVKPVATFDLGGRASHTYSLDLQITPDGNRMSVAVTRPAASRPMQVWELGATPKKVFESEQTYGGVTPALSPSGKRVVAHKSVYDVDSGKKLATLPEFTYSHAFFQGEDRVVATQRSHGFDKAEKRKVTVWDVAGNKGRGVRSRFPTTAFRTPSA